MRLRNGIFSSVAIAGVAQLAEQLICNQQVISSSLIAGSIFGLGLATSFQSPGADSHRWPRPHLPMAFLVVAMLD